MLWHLLPLVDNISKEMGAPSVIDVHCHILPGFDDGARDWGEAVRMAQLAAADGIQHIIATPHVMEGVYDHSPSSIQTAVQVLNQRLEDCGCPLTVWPGAEVYLHPDLSRWFRDGHLPTLAGNDQHVLIELPHTTLPLYTEQVLFELMLYGLTPVIAHPERQQQLAADLSRMAALAERGAWLQLNTESLEGAYGRRAKKAAESMLKHQLFHLLGSDSHSCARPPALKHAHQRVLKQTGEQLANQVSRNAAAVLQTLPETGANHE